jgi:hypothetical protein
MSALRPLNAACRCTAPTLTVSQSSSSINNSQSHRSSSQLPHSLRPNPAEGEGLASHSCEAGLWQCHPHIAGYHTTTCQQLPTLQREALHAAQPLSTGWVHTRHSGVDDIVSAFRYSQLPRALKVEAPRRVGRIPSRSKPSCSQQHHHPIPHLQACRTYEELAHRPCCRSLRAMTELLGGANDVLTQQAIQPRFTRREGRACVPRDCGAVRVPWNRAAARTERRYCNLSVPFNTPSRWDHGRTGLSPVRDPGLRPEPGAAQHGRSHALLNGQAL